MKENRFSLFILSTLIVLLHSPITFAQDSQSVTIPYDQTLTLTRDTSQFYTIDLTAVPPGVDVSLSAVSPNTGPKMYVSKNEASQRPISTETADYVSASYASNIIFISAKDLVGLRHLYVGLICTASKCETDLSFEYSKEISTTADGTLIIQKNQDLNQASSAIIRLTVPEVQNAERIVIHVDAIPTTNKLPSELSVFINKGNEIPFTNHAENIPRSSWFEGRTIVIHNNSDIFCTNCNYTLSLKFDRYSSISFQADVFEADMKLEGNAILDGAKPDYYNSYFFQLEETRKDKDIVIDIKPQEGTQRLLINCNKKPDNYTGYYWYYDIKSAMEITLTAREHQTCETGSFFMLVTSDEPSVYSIKVATKDTSRLFVGKDSPVEGDIFPLETISYEVFLPLFMAEKLLIELFSNTPINLSIVNCRFPTDCPGLLPAGIEFRHQLNNDNDTVYQPPEFKYELTQFNDSVKVVLDPHAEGCYPIIIEDADYMQDAVPVCAYKITLFSDFATPIEYTLAAKPEGHDWLYAGYPIFESVVKGEFAYFILYVPQEDIFQVNIQLTEFSGDVDIFVSKTEKYPRNATDEIQFAHEGMISFGNTVDLNGTYYIAVEGLETSSFSIVATVIGNSGNPIDYAQTLELGKPQKGVLLPNHEHPARFYVIELDLADDWVGTINIAVNTLRGTVLLCVNNDGEIPLPNEHMWRSTSQEVEISSTDVDFNPKGVYHIGVFIDWEVRQPEFEDVTFNIIAFLREATAGTESGNSGHYNVEHLFLSPMTPFYRTIKAGEIDYYEAFILPRDEKITVYKQADAGDVDLYVSLDFKNEYPTENQFNYTTRTTHRDSIELTSEDLSNTCTQEGMSSKLCSFYIAVIPKQGSDKVSYTITLKRDYAQKQEFPALQITPLEDGRQNQQHVPADGAPAYFYFYTVPFESSVITVACSGVDITIYALKNDIVIGSGIKPEFEVPNGPDDIYNFSSTDNGMSSVGLAHLTIPPQNSTNTTIISLAVHFKSTDRTGQPVPTSTIFNVLVSSKMTHIYTGKPYYGAVEAGKYMYFTLGVTKPSCTLLISLTTLNDGDPDLVVSTSIDNPPTLNSHQFASISNQKTEVLEINELDIYPKSSMEGTWVIGVFGMVNSTFVLTVMDEDEKMVDLKDDVPFVMYLRENSTMYFKHYHMNKSDLEIRVNQLSGSTVGYITTVLEDNDLFTNLPNHTTAKWTLDPSKSTVLSIPGTDAKACSDCLYLIALESSSYSKVSVALSESSSFTIIQGGTPYSGQLTGQGSKIYLFTSSTAEEITLSIVLRGPGLKMYASHNPEVSADDNLWTGELTASHPSKIISLVRSEIENEPRHSAVWNGIEYVKSQKNSFYIRFDNPTSLDVSYTFTVTSKDTSPILKPGAKYMMNLGANEATSMIYHSSKDDQVVKLDIEFSIEKDSSKISDEAFQKTLKQGVSVTANYWGEKVTTGLGKEVAVVKEDIIRDRTQTFGSVTTYHFREGFAIESKRGKFSFDIENPFTTNITLSATVYSSEFGTLSLDQNSQHSSILTAGMSETYEFYLGTQGAWYLWAFACNGDIQFSTDSNPDQLDKGVKVQKIKSGEGYLHELKVDQAPMQYARIESTDNAQFIMSSNFFFEHQHQTYALKAAVPTIKSSFEYQQLNNKILVNFEPLALDDFDATDEIVYHVKLCPLTAADEVGPVNYCIIREDCRIFQKKFRMNDQASVNATFDRMSIGKYYIHVTADIQHNDQFIKFIPYPMAQIEVYKPISETVMNNLSIVALALVGLLVAGILTYVCCGKLKKAAQQRGFELADIGRRRGYGFVGDDEQETSRS